MSLVAAIVSPHPPALIPEVAAGSAGELSDLRDSVSAALDRLWSARPDVVIVVGAGPATATFPAAAVGSFAGYGVPIAIRLDGGPAQPDAPRLPLSLAVGAWLLGSRPAEPPRRAHGVAVAAGAAECAALGATLAGSAARVGLLVMADGSACRGDKSPGYADPRAEAFDAAVTAALRAADPEALLAVDAGLAAALLAAGRPAWQVLAGAAGPAAWHGEIGYDAAPYGVQYTVATWEPA